MRARQLLLWSGTGLLVLLAACGSGGTKEATSGDAASTPAAGAAQAARLDRYVSTAKLPAGVTILVRGDMTNEHAAAGKAEYLQRFRESGRETGTHYVLGVDGAQRMQLGINQYSRPEGARAELARARPNPGAADKIDAAGLGEDYSAARVNLNAGGGATAYVNHIIFVRGRYLVSLADFANDAKASADTAVAVARAVDEQIKADPNP